MASGRGHDRATTALALPWGTLWWPVLGPQAAAVGALVFLVGGLWLSPDLDTHSRATLRWGPLHLLWWPYRRLLSHRSLLSHGPLLGTAGRLAYLAALLALAAVALAPVGAPGPRQLLAGLLEYGQRHRPLVITGLVSLEASAWLHLLQDGDPVLRLPRPLRALLAGSGQARRRGRGGRRRGRGRGAGNGRNAPGMRG